MLPVSIARLLRRAGQESRRYGRALLGQPDATLVEFEIDPDETTATLGGMIATLNRELAHALGAKEAVCTRVYVRVEALAYTTDREEVGEVTT